MFFFLTAYSGFLILLTLSHKNLCRSVKRWGRRWNRQRVTGIPILPCKFGVKLIPIRLWTSSDSNLEEGTGYVLRWGMTDRHTGRDLATKATSLKKYTGASQFKPFTAVETHDANEEDSIRASSLNGSTYYTKWTQYSTMTSNTGLWRGFRIYIPHLHKHSNPSLSEWLKHLWQQ